jgi:hypothetical protein
MAELYVMGGKDGTQLDEVDRYRYRSLVSWWLVFHENAYYQWRKGLLDAHSYKPWANDLNVFLRQQNVADHWKEMHMLFQDEFARHVSELIEECQKPKLGNGTEGMPSAAGTKSGLRMMHKVPTENNPEEGPHQMAGIG